MKRFLADLHIHTALSPCASPEMTPPVIVRAAIGKGLAMIAVCDHNTSGNAQATQEAAAASKGKLTVLAGLELTTIEEVHVLGLFPDAESARAVDELARASLPDRAVTSENFGQQVLLDCGGRITGREKKMLSGATKFTLEQAVRLIKSHGGLAIAAHADRHSFSVTSQLGFVPVAAGFDAIEVSPANCHTEVAERLAVFGLPVITSSDSHFLADIGGSRTALNMRDATFEEFALALVGADGRGAARA